MSGEKKLDEKILEQVAGGGEYDRLQSPEEIQAAKRFREPFISANCVRCVRRDTECTYPSGDVFDTLAMYHMFKDLPGCPFIVVK